MKKYKSLEILFAALAVLLSNAMCATVGYNYCALQWGGQYAGYSAPAWVAFLLCIPYGVGMVVCLALAWIFHKKQRLAA